VVVVVMLPPVVGQLQCGPFERSDLRLAIRVVPIFRLSTDDD
jgi:hypothetical protein